MSVDPLCEKYYSVSPYVYCLGNPINVIDSDGRLVIFINGFHFGAGGTQDYWDKNGGGFATAIMEHLNDDRALYIDGSVGGLENWKENTDVLYRMSNGYLRGKAEAQSLLYAIGYNLGYAKETIKIITHSMGVAYAKGYVQGLIEYFEQNGVPLDIIEFEADFAPYQPTKQSANPKVKTYQFSHSKDKLAGNDGMQGAEYMDTNSDQDQGHRIKSFVNQVLHLPTGNYKVVDGIIVPN